MSLTRRGEFEYLMLTAVARLGDAAYGVAIPPLSGGPSQAHGPRQRDGTSANHGRRSIHNAACRRTTRPKHLAQSGSSPCSSFGEVATDREQPV